MIALFAILPLVIGIAELMRAGSGEAIVGVCFVFVGIYFLYTGSLAWRSFSPKAVKNVCVAITILVILLVLTHLLLRPLAPDLAEVASLALLPSVMIAEHCVSKRLSRQYFPDRQK